MPFLTGDREVEVNRQSLWNGGWHSAALSQCGCQAITGHLPAFLRASVP